MNDIMFRMPPEWAPQDWLWIGFPHDPDEWPASLPRAQEQIATFASAVAESRSADPRELAPVWRLLLESPSWRAVLYQYPALRQVRELMVHTSDLMTECSGAGPAA